MNAIPFVNTDLPDIVELRNVSQSYDSGQTYIIKDLNLLIEDKLNTGQFVVLLGASGCGKTSVLRYISGLQKPSSGEVFFKGQPLTEQNRVSLIFQQYSSFPWLSVLDNVALALDYKGVSKAERREKAMELIKIVGLDGHENKFAKYPTLSGGQLQRVAIARSLLSNNEILLMDEPFGALDVNTRLRMQDLLIEIFEKVHPTILLVTHDISEAVYLGEDIYIMASKPGRIVKHIKVDLGKHRSKDTKRDKHFIEYVQDIEDMMVALEQSPIAANRL